MRIVLHAIVIATAVLAATAEPAMAYPVRSVSAVFTTADPLSRLKAYGDWIFYLHAGRPTIRNLRTGEERLLNSTASSSWIGVISDGFVAYRNAGPTYMHHIATGETRAIGSFVPYSAYGGIVLGSDPNDGWVKYYDWSANAVRYHAPTGTWTSVHSFATSATRIATLWQNRYDDSWWVSWRDLSGNNYGSFSFGGADGKPGGNIGGTSVNFGAAIALSPDGNKLYYTLYKQGNAICTRQDPESGLWYSVYATVSTVWEHDIPSGNRTTLYTPSLGFVDLGGSGSCYSDLAGLGDPSRESVGLSVQGNRVYYTVSRYNGAPLFRHVPTWLRAWKRLTGADTDLSASAGVSVNADPFRESVIWAVSGQGAYFYQDIDPPAGFAASSVSSSQIALTWSNPATNVTGRFELRDGGALLQAGGATAFTHSVGPNTTHAYGVRAAEYAIASDEVALSVTSLANPPAPAGLGSVTATSLRAVWSGNGNPAGTQYYPVLTRASDGVRLQAPGWTADLVQEFGGLTPNTAYDVWVKARNATGAETVAIPVVQGRYSLASAPASLSGAASQTAVTLTWSANGNPSGTVYRVFRGGVQIGTTTALSYADAGLTPGASYDYAVAAVNGEGVESPRATLTRRTLPPHVAVTAESGGLDWHSSEGRGWVVLAWTPANGATGYILDVFDGGAHREFDLGTATRWDSREARIYPGESVLDAYADNTMAGDPWNRVQGGLNLRDRPTKLYRKTPGTAFDDAIHYLFHVRPYNESGAPDRQGAQPVNLTLPDRTDGVPPSASLEINGGAVQAGSPSVNLTVRYADDESGVEAVRFSNDGVTWSAWESLSAPAAEGAYTRSNWRLLAGPGARSAYAQARDRAGNVSSAATASIYVAYDTTSPDVTLRINGGAPTTNTTSVTLTVSASSALTAPGDLRMRFSNDGGASYSEWEPYRAVKAWTLAAGNGLKTVAVEVKNQAGNVGLAVANIRLVASVGEAPAPGPPGGWVVSDSGVPTTVWLDGASVEARLVSNPRVQLRFDRQPPPAQVEFSVDGVTYSRPEAYAARKTLPLPPGDGPKTVLVRFVEADGTESAVHHVDFLLDTTPPRVEARWLGGASVTSGATARLVLTVEDRIAPPAEMRVSLDRGVTWGPLRELLDAPVPEVGYNVVPVWVRDQAGNVAKVNLEMLRVTP